MLDYQWEMMKRIDLFNAQPKTPEGVKAQNEILKEALGTYNEGIIVTPPVYANWGLRNVHVGKDTFFNFNTVFVDDGRIEIGEHCMIGPNCTFVGAQHPISPSLRLKGLQYNKTVRVGNNVWFGAGVTVLPGVTIGDNTVVGAGSVVTRDLPANVVAVGNPARVLRPITERDDRFFDHDKPVPEEWRD
ncbi:MAG: sugar O-acetyltransferase [Lachnospiraceae bacterium]|nr:sugar O-acetyltransferase [Lachnospiraceae bacterium]